MVTRLPLEQVTQGSTPCSPAKMYGRPQEDQFGSVIQAILQVRTNMSITVRSMTIEDYKQVHGVDILTQKQYLGAKFNQMSEEEKDSYLVSRKSEFQINVNAGYCFIAEDDNKNIVGFILAHETLPFHGTLYIRYIGVKPEVQGQGIGQLLYEKLIEKAKETDMKKIVGLVNNDNPNSIKLLEKVGFKLTDRKQATLEIDKKEY